MSDTTICLVVLLRCTSVISKTRLRAGSQRRPPAHVSKAAKDWLRNKPETSPTTGIRLPLEKDK